MLAGGQLSVTGRFSPARFFDDVARLRPTYFSAVPTIYALLVSQDTVGDTSSLRFAVCGGAAPISKELLDHAEQRFGLVIVEGYGLTEARARPRAIRRRAFASRAPSAPRCRGRPSRSSTSPGTGAGGGGRRGGDPGART